MFPRGLCFAASTGVVRGQSARACFAVFVAVVVASLTTACDGPPDRPSHLEQFRVIGPSEVAPGSTARFEAIFDKVATLSDVSAETQWTSSNPAVLSIDAGLATGRAAGEATVTARFEQQQTDPMPVMVLPPGTFRVRGRVTTGSIGVAQVRVEVPTVGLTTTTDSQGRFTLYGVPANGPIHTVKDGYFLTITAVQLANHDQQLSIFLRPKLQGTYTLTISPGTCTNGPPLPANLLQRSYTVVLTQTGGNGTQAQGTMPGANLTVLSFAGSFSANQEQWTLGIAIGERLPDGNAVTFNGGAVVRAADLTGTFNGRIALNNPSADDALARCEASGFLFVLRP